MIIRTLIIDDEAPARDLVKSYLETHNDIELLGEYDNGLSGLKAINETNPDLVFLDIQMPKLTGFEVAELLEKQPNIVFITAYDQYAIKAFEMNAIDYLLKPYSKERFDKAVDKVKRKLQNDEIPEDNLQKLTEAATEHQDNLNRIAIKKGSSIVVVPVDDIVYFESNGDYVNIHTKAARYIKERTMKFLEERLDSKHFVRIHRSYIVNIKEINKIELFDKLSYMVILKDNTKLKVSTAGYKQLKKVLGL